MVTAADASAFATSGALPNDTAAFLAGPRRDEPAAAAAAPAGAAAAVPFRAGLLRALRHWRAYYAHQTYERQFVEYQTGVPFRAWQAAARAIERHVAPRLPDA